MDYSNTEPVRLFAKRRNFSPTKVYDLDAAGEIQTVLIGKRRHVIVPTYDAYVRRLLKQQAGAKLPSSNPKAKAQEAAASPRPFDHRQRVARPRQEYLGSSRRASSRRS